MIKIVERRATHTINVRVHERGGGYKSKSFSLQTSSSTDDVINEIANSLKPLTTTKELKDINDNKVVIVVIPKNGERSKTHLGRYNFNDVTKLKQFLYNHFSTHPKYSNEMLLKATHLICIENDISRERDTKTISINTKIPVEKLKELFLGYIKDVIKPKLESNVIFPDYITHKMSHHIVINQRITDTKWVSKCISIKFPHYSSEELMDEIKNIGDYIGQKFDSVNSNSDS